MRSWSHSILTSIQTFNKTTKIPHLNLPLHPLLPTLGRLPSEVNLSSFENTLASSTVYLRPLGIAALGFVYSSLYTVPHFPYPSYKILQQGPYFPLPPPPSSNNSLSVVAPRSGTAAQPSSLDILRPDFDTDGSKNSPAPKATESRPFQRQELLARHLQGAYVLTDYSAKPVARTTRTKAKQRQLISPSSPYF